MENRLEKKLDWINSADSDTLLGEEDILTEFIHEKLRDDAIKLHILSEVQHELTIRELELEDK